MEIIFEANVKKYFEDYSIMINEIGTNLTKSTKKRVDQLKASKTLQKYLTYKLGSPHPLHGNLEGCIGVSITGNFRLVFLPINEKKIKIKGVVDYHGSKENWLIP